MPSGDLQHKRILVTGGGSGIGRACALLAARAGARVALAGRRAAVLEQAVQDLRAAGSEALAIPCDVSRECQVRELFRRAARAWGGLDGLVNSAGVFRRAGVLDLDLDLWQEVLGTNLNGTFLCCREAFRCLAPGGSIVNVASLSGVWGVEKFPGFTAYNVSKYGVVGLTEILALEGRGLGLRVNCVSPGAVATDMLRQAAPQLPGLPPDEVARVVLFLLSDAGRAVNGENFILAGPSAESKNPNGCVAPRGSWQRLLKRLCGSL